MRRPRSAPPAMDQAREIAFAEWGEAGRADLQALAEATDAPGGLHPIKVPTLAVQERQLHHRCTARALVGEGGLHGPR